MRVAQVAVGAALLLLLLTWLMLRSASQQALNAQATLGVLDELMVAESALHSDLLSARSGLLNNYDPLVAENVAIRGTVPRLRALIGDNPTAAIAIDRLARAIDLQEEGTEQFKSRNALLRNSLAYFRLFSARLTRSPSGPTVARQVSVLTEAMLHLTLDTSPRVVAEVDSGLAGLTIDSAPTAQAETLRALLAHGRMLRALLPTIDSGLKSLFSVSTAQEQDTIRKLTLARVADNERNAAFYQYVLYAVSLILLCILLRLGFLLQARARHLQRRAAIEHAIAGVSTRFIGAHNEELEAHVVAALQELSHCLGADRAYFLTRDERSFFCRWAAPGIPFPPGWPEAAFAVLGDEAAPGLIYVGDGGPHAGCLDETTPAADVRCWLCITDPAGEEKKRLLGFDGLRRGLRIGPTEFGLCRMAFDAIVHAIDRSALECERARLERKLQHTRRMETIGALASGVAHNFNNIVGAILGYAEMAQAHVPDGSATENLREIRRAGERARDLIDQILSFGRRSGEASRQSIVVDGLLADVESMVAATLDADVSLTLRTAGQLLVVYGQPAQLQQGLVNMCRNAVQAIEGPGSVEISACLVDLAVSLEVDSGKLPPGRYALIAVADTGKGMDKATRARIFEPFFTTRPDGNGLGLATALEVVREHGGGIAVESRPGSGSRFEVWLPCGTVIQAEAQAAPRATLARGNGEAVLVCDPDHARLLKAEEILAALGYEPTGFSSLSEAIAACQAEPRRFEILLVCLERARDSSGGETVGLHRSAPGLPIVLAIASAADLLSPELADAGVSEIIGLPLSSNELAGALARCRPRRRGPATPPLAISQAS